MPLRDTLDASLPGVFAGKIGQERTLVRKVKGGGHYVPVFPSWCNCWGSYCASIDEWHPVGASGW